jgi:hypothetical protein
VEREGVCRRDVGGCAADEHESQTLLNELLWRQRLLCKVLDACREFVEYTETEFETELLEPMAFTTFDSLPLDAPPEFDPPTLWEEKYTELPDALRSFRGIRIADFDAKLGTLPARLNAALDAFDPAHPPTSRRASSGTAPAPPPAAASAAAGGAAGGGAGGGSGGAEVAGVAPAAGTHDTSAAGSTSSSAFPSAPGAGLAGGASAAAVAAAAPGTTVAAGRSPPDRKP